MIDAPFPYFGGKKRVASEVWDRFGDVANYVEPFFGSGAMLLNRPHPPGIETVNDKDHFISNFWRAVKADPVGLAEAMDYPVNETDLASRHSWLVQVGRLTILRCEIDPEFYDLKVAAWWCWGLCSWIAGGWCDGRGPWVATDDGWVKRDAEGDGINRQLPHLGGGRGINRQLPLTDWMLRLADRLRRVKMCNGDWSRVLGPSPTFKHGLTGVFLDPPYSLEAGRNNTIYSHESGTVAHDVREWAIANGDNPLMRICLCGYDTEHAMPDGWKRHQWKAHGGYGSQGEGAGRENAERETLWFSPHCLGEVAPRLL